MLCFVVVMQSFIMNSHEVFIHIHQGCFAGTGAIVRLPQCQWSKPDGYGKINQCITTTKHSKAKTVCIFLGRYYIYIYIRYACLCLVVFCYPILSIFRVTLLALVLIPLKQIWIIRDNEPHPSIKHLFCGPLCALHAILWLTNSNLSTAIKQILL